MLVDANVLLYARDAASPFHERARTWLTAQLNGPVRVGLPWPSLIAFIRIGTHPRAYDRPLSPRQAWEQVQDWLGAPAVWIPEPTHAHEAVLGDLVLRYDLRANILSDAHLAALAIEHGLTLCSADTDFARFTELRWVDPVTS
ncbi:type II toxin-antitoxin system VapC family toxin [soil metagenome]